MDNFEQVSVLIGNLFGQVVASEFTRTLAIFSAAAWVHSRTVSKTIRSKIDELIAVFRDDHEKQKKVVADLRNDVDTIKGHLKL